MLILTFLAICSTSIANYASPGCGTTLPAGQGTSTSYTMTFQGVERTYIVYIPANFDQNSYVGQPMVLNLPGYTTTADFFEQTFLENTQADTNNYLAVYLEGSTFLDPNPPNRPVISWNDQVCGASPGPFGTTCNPYNNFDYPRPVACEDTDGNNCNWCNCVVNDVEWVDYISEYIEDRYCIDMTREYAVGFSNGGMMVHTLACELADRFGAVTSFHGQRGQGFNCIPNNVNAMPIMNIWGINDRAVPGQNILAADGYYYQAVSNVQQQFAVKNGCDLTDGLQSIPTVSDGIRNWQCVGWNKNCIDGAYVQGCQWGVGNRTGYHRYPIAQGQNFGLTASWEYMSQFRRIPPRRFSHSILKNITKST